MKKHQTFISELFITNFEIMDSKLSDKDLGDEIRRHLAYELANEILKNKDLLKVELCKNVEKDGTTFRSSLVVVNPSDYKKLEDIIDRFNFNVMDKGNGVRLADLL